MLSDGDIRIYGELLATRIIAARLWGYLAMLSKEPDYLDKQCIQCLQSLDLWKFEGSPDARDSVKVKETAAQSIRAAFKGLVAGKPSGTPLQ